MTREECELKICEKVKEIWEIYSEYNPDGYSLGLFTNRGGLVMVNNEYFKEDAGKPIAKTMNFKGERGQNNE